jgi:hypothetical protein
LQIVNDNFEKYKKLKNKNFRKHKEKYMKKIEKVRLNKIDDKKERKLN